jgi:hypothetical protein
MYTCIRMYVYIHIHVYVYICMYVCMLYNDLHEPRVQDPTVSFIYVCVCTTIDMYIQKSCYHVYIQYHVMCVHTTRVDIPT